MHVCIVGSVNEIFAGESLRDASYDIAARSEIMEDLMLVPVERLYGYLVLITGVATSDS